MKKVYSCLCLVALLLSMLAGCAKEPVDSQQVLQQRRDTVEAHMRYMMSALWQTDTTIDYSYNVSSLGAEHDEEGYILHLEAGRVYSGMPYTHGSGGAESFFLYGQPDEKGVIQMSGLTADLISGGGGTKPNNQARLSNDCADAVSWAWSRVGNSFTFTMTQNMTAQRGCLPVGNYKTVEDAYKKTREIVKENGESVMFEAYACLQKADAVVCYNGSGHAMLVSQVNVVRNGNAIDPEQSYVLVHEQFTGNAHKEVTRVDEATGLTVYCLGGVDRQYTFAQLYKKSYLPITIKELIDPTPVPAPDLVDSVKEPDISNLFEGSITCLYKITMVTVTITDSQGTVVQRSTCFPRETERHMFRMSNFADSDEAAVRQGTLVPDDLASGTYHCLVECLVGTGESIAVRDFVFEVTE